MKMFNSSAITKLFLSIAVSLMFVAGEVSDSFASAEWVYVAKIFSNDNQGIIVRANGDAYQIEKGTGCISFWRHEGKRVLISSPGLFLGVGSELILPDVDQKCRIWDSKSLGQWSSSPPKASSRSLSVSASKDDVKIFQVALKALGHYKGEPDGIIGELTKQAI